ncbi:MAG: helix-turn-helix transcriptional regulator [Gemmatimonadetes bacterium]|jgi:PadR family transcriptional regulator PadR|nr:helix-turn-helix transcriptional regulator [Gemmatimonadota bacterium]
MGRALGGFEQTVLLALLQLGDDADGVSIRRRIEARTGMETSTGALYTTLERLAKRGLISFELGDSTPERGGRRKRRYRLEKEGLLALRESFTVFTSMIRGVEALLDLDGEPERP